MISSEDIEAFQEQSAPAFEAGAAFVRRKRRGIPPDRWATTEGLRLVAECIERQWVIITMLSDAAAAMSEDAARRADEAMGVYDRNGRRTS